MALNPADSSANLRLLKTNLHKSSRENPINCVVVLLKDGSVGIAAHKVRHGRDLARDAGSQDQVTRTFDGKAYLGDDGDSGTLYLILDKAVGSLESKLKVALRGIGIHKIEISAG